MIRFAAKRAQHSGYTDKNHAHNQFLLTTCVDWSAGQKSFTLHCRKTSGNCGPYHVGITSLVCWIDPLRQWTISLETASEVRYSCTQAAQTNDARLDAISSMVDRPHCGLPLCIRDGYGRMTIVWTPRVSVAVAKSPFHSLTPARRVLSAIRLITSAIHAIRGLRTEP